MEKLKEEVKKNGFTYRQIVRSDNVALYEQIDNQGILAGHELFKIKVMPAGDVFGTMMPEREIMPKDADFGVTAWSVGISPARAILKYAELVTIL